MEFTGAINRFTRFNDGNAMKRKVLQEGTQEKIDALAHKVEEALCTEKDVKVIMTILMTCLHRSIECCSDPKNARDMVVHIMSRPIEEYMSVE